MENGTAYVLGTKSENGMLCGDTIVIYESKDLINWSSRPLISRDGWQFFNSSLTKGENGYVLLLEFGPHPFSYTFAMSPDMLNWTFMPDECIFGKDRYVGGPWMRYSNGWYYVIAVEPAINVKTEAIEIKCDNTALLLVRFLGVLNNDIAKDKDRNISIITEVSYMELGNRQIGVYMIPGELSPELESGNFLPAEQAANDTEADYKPLTEMSRCEHNFVIGLCNDEIGYIIPENDFLLHEWLPYFNNTDDENGRRHYEETNSLGPNAAGAILDAMDELINS